jgi:hypothetical protein
MARAATTDTTAVAPQTPHGINVGNSEQLTPDQAGARQGCYEAEADAPADQHERRARFGQDDGRAAGAERHAEADLSCAA